MADLEMMTAAPEAALPLVSPQAKTASADRMGNIEEHPHWVAIARMPVVLTARVPLTGFKVRDLLMLEQGQLVRSEWSTSEDIPVKIGRVQLAWSEFEVVDESMAMRLTRLA